MCAASSRPPGDPAVAARRRRDLRLGRWLATLISAVVAGLGLWSILTQTYSGRGRFGAEVALSGSPAVLAGAMTIALGLLPLALWFSSPRRAAAWAAVCTGTFALLLWSLVLR
ncbi:MAG: hypothetical protein U5L03_10115 [Burkholderiaceae bacterium]|nr:hypothetical protein [Burkholderiaceae bacterium]